jgi:cyanophycinase
MKTFSWACVPVLLLAFGQSYQPRVMALEPAGESAERTRPYAPTGGLLLVGGGRVPAEARQRFVALAGGKQAKIVVVPTASATVEERDEEYWLEPWREFEPLSLQLFHTRDRAQADAEDFCRVLREATGIWISGGDQSNLAKAYLSTKAQAAIESLPYRGGIVGGTSAGAAIASRRIISGGKTTPTMATGFNLLPAAIVDQHFTQRNRMQRLRQAIAQFPDCVGIGIDEGTAALFQLRSMQVIGPGQVRLQFAETEYAEASELNLAAGQRADWTTFVRMNQERSAPEFPVAGEKPQVMFPESGSLVIVGGGRLPRAVVKRFVDLAGGAKAKIVVLPTAVEPPDSEPSIAETFIKAGAQEVKVLPQTSFAEIASDEYLDALRSASGIWFGGGRQWRLVDHYEATPALDEFRNCLARGGVIGGSSAGASIQGELLIRGAPVGNQIMVQDGYRRGLAFLKGVGIDQHFSQRNRLDDLKGTVARFPSIVGVGIDEATALCVTPTSAEVVGPGKVHVLIAANANANPPAANQDTDQDTSEEITEDPPVAEPIEVQHRQYQQGDALTVDDFALAE